jgi:hypothetical protein
MITTEYIIHQDSKQLSDRMRVKAFFRRADVAAQMQAYGIHPEEALARVDSLTDSEIASIAGMMDQISAKAGGTFALDGGLLMFIGMAMFAIVAAILIYFSFYSDKEEKPE